MSERTHLKWCTEHVTETGSCTTFLETPVPGVALIVAAGRDEQPTITLDGGPVCLAPADALAVAATLADVAELVAAARSAA